MQYADEDAEDFIPSEPIPTDLAGAIRRDPIATVRSLVRVVRNLFESP
jgi:hypothetical protein